MAKEEREREREKKLFNDENEKKKKQSNVPAIEFRWIFFSCHMKIQTNIGI